MFQEQCYLGKIEWQIEHGHYYKGVYVKCIEYEYGGRLWRIKKM